MRFISPAIHGFIDYAAAMALIVAPFLILPGNAPLAATALSVAAGSALILYSLITDYSISVRKALPFSVHLVIDFVAGVAFVLAPFVLGFEGVTKLYFLVMGAAVIMVVLLTNPSAE